MLASVLAVGLAVGPLLGVGPPYEARLVANANASTNTPVRYILSEDLDGDGVDEKISGCMNGILFRSWRDGSSYSDFQFNLPPRFISGGRKAPLEGACDVDGDGWREILVPMRSADGWEQRLWAIDPRRDDPVLDVALRTGPDLREDGVWDGEHHILAVREDAAGPIAYLTRNVSYDRSTRGIVAIDLHSGREIWYVPTAGIVNRGGVADLDGDGSADLVVGVGASNNLRTGEAVNGRLDDVSWVMALDADGALMWELRLDPYFAEPRPIACDLDGDGRAEVAVLNRCTSAGAVSRLMVLDGATGAVLASSDCSGVPAEFAVWRDDRRGVGMLAVGGEDRSLIRYVWNGGALEPVRTEVLSAPVARLLAADLVPEPGLELVVVSLDGRVVIQSSAGEVLARGPAVREIHFDVAVWDLDPEPLLVYCNELNAGLRLVPVPAYKRYGRATAAGGLLLVAGLGGGHLLRQRRRLRALRRTSRLDLLRAFLTSRHGTVGPVGVLERALWAAENPGAVPPERLAETWASCATEARPDLEALLEKAAHTRIDPPLLTIVRREYGRFAEHMDRLVPLAADDKARAAAVQAARTSFGLLADGMRSLGATLAASCRADAAAVARSAVGVHAQRRVAVRFELVVDAPGPVDVHADRLDLEFALDNLLDNAGRAVAGRPRAAVTVTVAATGAGRISVIVDDNGPGVPAADRERIFAAGVSTRPGGGVGLWHSRDALRYYGGDLAAGEAPGGGARFTITLRPASG